MVKNHIRIKTNRQFKSLGSIVIILCALVLPAQSQVAVGVIRDDLDALKDVEDHRKFWRLVYESDQEYRGAQSVDSIDRVNLVKSCLYFNRFGYPDPEALGKEAGILPLVWIHNRYPGAAKHSFPIILEGFRKGAISRFDLIDYYIGSIYRRAFPKDSLHLKPLKQLLAECRVNTVDTIDIRQLLDIMDREAAFLIQPFDTIGIWQEKDEQDTLVLNDQQLIVTHEGDQILIFRNEEGSYFFNRSYPDRSHYPQPIRKAGKRFYPFRDQDHFFEINHHGNLIFFYKGKAEKQYINLNNK